MQNSMQKEYPMKQKMLPKSEKEELQRLIKQQEQMKQMNKETQGKKEMLEQKKKAGKCPKINMLQEMPRRFCMVNK